MSESFDDSSIPPVPPLQQIAPPPVPSGPQPAAKPQRHPFALSPANKILFLLAFAYFAISIFAMHGITSYQGGRFLACLFIVIFIPWLIARIFWLCTGRRKRGGSLACTIATIMFVFLHFMFMSDAQIQERRIRLELRREEAAKVEPWRDSYATVQSEDIPDLSLLTSDQEFTRQRSIVTLYIEASAAYRDYYANMIPNLQKRLDDFAEDKPHGKAYLEGVISQHLKETPIMDRFVQAHVDYGDSMLKLLDLLQSNRSQWSLENDQFMCDSAKVGTRYNELLDVFNNNRETINTLGAQLSREVLGSGRYWGLK